MQEPVKPSGKLKTVIDRLNKSFKGKASLRIEVYEPTYAIFSDGEIAIEGEHISIGFRLGTDSAVVAVVARVLIGIGGCVFQEIPVFFGDPTPNNADGIFFHEEAYAEYAKDILRGVGDGVRSPRSAKTHKRRPKHPK